MRPLRGFGIILLTIVLASAWGCGSTATKEGTGEYVDDSVITTKVKAAIFGNGIVSTACDPLGVADEVVHRGDVGDLEAAPDDSGGKSLRSHG